MAIEATTPDKQPRTGLRAVKAVAQGALGAVLIFAGVSHLTTAREEFQAQVPSWFPADPDTVVVVSGIAEITMGSALLLVWKQPHRRRLGLLVAAFFLAVFPGNIAQYLEHKDGFGLDTDAKRLARLPFQLALIAWALLATRGRRPR